MSSSLSQKFSNMPFIPVKKQNFQINQQNFQQTSLFNPISNVQQVQSQVMPTQYKIRFSEGGYVNRADLGFDFFITSKFYPTLLQMPKLIDNTQNNAYVFGPDFPLNQYKHLGHHVNDGAETALIDITNLNQQQLEAMATSQVWGEYVGDTNQIENYRRYFPNILFVGTTYGGDVGADIFAHYDQNGEINGLIIDVGYLFDFEIDENDHSNFYITGEGLKYNQSI